MSSWPPNLPSRQTGLVIIIVLMIVALMITLLVFMVEKQHILVRRIGNQNISEQGYQYAQGLNAWAERMLHDDKDRVVDYLGEDWAKFGRPQEAADEESSFSLRSSLSDKEKKELPMIDFGIDGLEVTIDDLQGRYNLNNLVTADPAARKDQKRIFLNLLQLLEIGDLGEQESLHDVLLDWIDENDMGNANGKESGEYRAKSTPYYAADQKLTSLGELRFLDGFSEEVINRLSPYVSVLPVDNAKLNINTASAEVLASLNGAQALDTASVTAFLASRLDENFLGFQQADIQAAETAIIGANPGGSQPIRGMMQTSSQFFQINAKVTLGDSQYCMRTVVLRDKADPNGLTAPKVSVLNRQHDTLCKESGSANTGEGDDTISEDEDLS